MLPTDPSRGPLRRLLIYFGLAENPDEPDSDRGPAARQDEAPSGKAHSALAYFGLAQGPADSRYGPYVKPRLDEDLDALHARVAELEARLAALEAGR